MSNAQPLDDSGLFPPLPSQLEGLEGTPEPGEVYAALLETICGATDDSQPVEQYDGTLGVTTNFVAALQGQVGQIQWNTNLAAIYTNPGNVSGVRWCTGTLLPNNLFLTAGHCFDQTGGGWQRPLINGTTTVIPSTEIATNMHINFNFQVDPAGNPRPVEVFAVEALLEYRLGGLDYAILRLAGSPADSFGRGVVAAKDAQVNDMLCIIGHPAGVPKRIEAGPLLSFSGNAIRYNDIDTLGGNSGSAIFQSPSGEIVGVHTNGGCNPSGTGANFGVRVDRLLEVSPILRSLLAPPPLHGLHTIQQVSNQRFVDAHESSVRDFRAVTRTAQNNDTQRWNLILVGTVYTIQQQSNERFVDAHEIEENDFRLVTRTAQNNATQRWVLREVNGQPSTYTIQQASNGRYVDAHETADNDFRLVTRAAQNNDSQRWLLSPLGGGLYRLQQKVNGRFVDAHEIAEQDFALVTREAQDNDTQRWRLTPAGAVCAIQQVSSARYLDAHEIAEKDFAVVTRPPQNNDTQRWVLVHQGGQVFTIQQLSNGRYLDAHEVAANDFSVVTREAQDNATQRWLIKPV